MESTLVNIPGYHIEGEIYQGSRVLVYRAYRETDSLPVVIKLLRNPYPSFSELVKFRNQYTIAKNLNSPLIIETYSLEVYQNGYVLVMEDFQGISLKDYLASVETLSLTCLQEFLEIGITLCNALDILYRNRIIHKDIKPRNILINPETKQVKLIDFSISSLLPRETQEVQNAHSLEGTLSYISPEQTGRMNRGIDYRSDFYSLGITFYELLTGKLPFIYNDPMELVHAHLAKTPIFVHEQIPHIPLVVSEIINKLMAKNAEDRYQSALGIRYDLEICLHQLQTTGNIELNIEYFKLGERDISDRFLIPEKLYGREKEVKELLEAFERVSTGNSELMLVVGFSGIGKTAVVNEIHKPIVRQRGYFIKGKFDQFNRNIPFLAFVQAFRDLIAQLIVESDTQIQEWKTKIIHALGDNAQVIIDVIPELARIIGPQPPTTELSGTAAQNRFNLLWQKFVQVFTTKEHPLVMFLDDLQWADLASLQLIQLLMGDASQTYLLLIGAYRDNEVDPAHPLMLTLDKISAAGSIINTINLQPLSQVTLNQLVADTLKCKEDLAFPLAQLIHRKTQGNPFFTTQLLKSLYQDGLIEFNWTERCWQCSISQVNHQTLTDNVVEFMVLQLQKLPESTQEVLKLAACIGNQFDLQTLAIISEQLDVEVAASLWKALQSDLILPQSEIYKFYQDTSIETQTTQTTQTTFRDRPIAKYKFLHDRVQQAAYSLIPDDQKQATHLQIGRLLQQNLSDTENEEKLFEIVGHLNQGKQLISESSECYQLVELNLRAGYKAKSSAAYIEASNYFDTAIQLLTPSGWEQHYQMMFTLYRERAEVEYLNTNFEQSEALINVALSQAKSTNEQAELYCLLAVQLCARANYATAIETGINALKLLGVDIERSTIQANIDQEIVKNKHILEGRAISSLLDLPEMDSPEQRMILQLLINLDSSAYITGDLNLFILVTAKAVNISMNYGNVPSSTKAYANYGFITGTVLGDYKSGYEFGVLALNLSEKFDHKGQKSQANLVLGFCLYVYARPIAGAAEINLEGYQAGLLGGEPQYASYNLAGNICNQLFQGISIDLIWTDIQDYLPFGNRTQNQLLIDTLTGVQLFIAALLFNPSAIDSPAGLHLRHEEFIQRSQSSGTLSALSIYYICQMQLACINQDFAQGLVALLALQPILSSINGCTPYTSYYFYGALILLNCENDLTLTVDWEQIDIHQERLKTWADNCPENFLNKYFLVEAERQKVLRNKAAAIEYYDLAISEAKQNAYIQEESLANELAAKFYLDWGKEKVAASYLQEAYYGYSFWGAKTKIDDLERIYPQLLQPILQQQKTNLLEAISPVETFSSSHTSNSTSSSNALDFTSVLKAAQAISSSIELDELLINLTRIILENSGAKKSALVLPQEDIWQVRVITRINQQSNFPNGIETILNSQPLDTCRDIPTKIINYVKNTQQPILINNCQTDIPGLIKLYMLEHQPKSVLCTPIINQGRLIAILYLENQPTSGVFTQERLQVINLLSSQVAISLENAWLYQKAQQALQNLQQAQLQLIQSEKMSALGNLVAGVGHEMNNPLGFISATLKESKDVVTDIIEHLSLYQEIFTEPGDKIIDHATEIDLDYSLQDLPKMIDSMTIASNKLNNISTSLRTFSRADRDCKVPFDIHEGIDSTILILKHRLKANEKHPAIEVITNYGNLSLIKCFPGQLNQVFMNILANAIDALEESNSGKSFAEIKANPNKITIQTSMENNLVTITIADNGKGMSESVQQKVFDYLFTTKSVGQGTGLGLAIARQIIVEKHGGAITVNSIPDQGTEFTIQLPLIPDKD